MARINLLPWRAEKRKKRQRDFLVLTGFMAGSMAVIVILAHLFEVARIDNQHARNRFLEQQIAEVDAKIKEIDKIEKQKQQLIDRMKVIQRLQQGRPEIVHVFDEIVKATPDGLFLTSIMQRGRILTIEGMAESNARVSQLMRSLDASPYFDNPTLNVIQAFDKSDRRKFRLTVPQTSQAKEIKSGAPNKKAPSPTTGAANKR